MRETGNLASWEQDDSEEIVRQYFDERGWSHEKLDTPGRAHRGQASDWRFCLDELCFLCEVKTIESARAEVPYAPVVDHFIEVRNKQRTEIEEWQKTHPDRKLVFRPGQREFLYGDDREFRRQYDRRRNTQAEFDSFAIGMKEYFLDRSSIRGLPYHLRLDSDDLYAPNQPERVRFFQWLEEQIQTIHHFAQSMEDHSVDSSVNRQSFTWTTREPPYISWHVESQGAGLLAWYSTSYPIHKVQSKADVDRRYQITVTGPMREGKLEVSIHGYGVLNLDALDRNVKKATQQLNHSASRERFPEIARVVVLAFRGGLDLEWGRLADHIASLLRQFSKLSAIAVLRWHPDGIPPAQEDDFQAWMKFFYSTPAVPAFVVYHNTWLQGVSPLPIEAFKDNWSVQLCPLHLTDDTTRI